MKTKNIVVSLTLIVMFMNLAQTTNAQYLEDFTTKQHCDTLNTTAWWDTIAGELSLNPFTPTLTGSYDTPGYASSVAIAGNYAYVADFELGGLQVIDITDPTTPILAGSCDPGGYPYGVTISGNYAYVCNFTLGLQSIDITDPSSPTLDGVYDTPTQAREAVVAGNYAYVVDRDSGLMVVDITNPSSPSLAGSYDTPGEAHGIAVAGDYAYVADYNSGLQVIDISNPFTPTLAGSYDTPGSSAGIALSGDYAYIADRGGLQVIDISDPTNPVHAGDCATFNALSVWIAGDYAYVADEASGLTVINIADPTNPTVFGGYDTPDISLDVAVEGPYAYIADYQSGLMVINVADTIPPMFAARHSPSGPNVWSVAVSGNHAYLADRADGLRVVDVSDPTNPTAVTTYPLTGDPWVVEVEGDLAFVSDWDSGFYVIDISDPATPTLAGFYAMEVGPRGIDIEGNFAYLAGMDSGLVVLDIEDPTNPTQVGSYHLPVDAYFVVADGNYAYVAARYHFQAIDVSDPTNPIGAGTYTLYSANGTYVSGDHVFVADSRSLRILDISNPNALTLAATFDQTIMQAEDVVVIGDIAYVADAYAGMVLVDVSDPTTPVHIVTYDPGGIPHSIAIDGDFAYIASGSYGLQTVQVFNRTADLENNVAQSIGLTASGIIDKVKLIPDQTGSILWEVSADDGAHWQQIPDTTWNDLAYPGQILKWRSTLLYEDAGVYPSCNSLEIILDGVVNVAVQVTAFEARQRDKQVELSWNIETDEEIKGFNIYRKAVEKDRGALINTGGLVPPQVRHYVDDGVLAAGKTFFYSIGIVLEDGSEVLSHSVSVRTKVNTLELYQNHPNPFNPTTTISFSLPREMPVDLSIYNVQGKLVRTLIKEKLGGGLNEVKWDGTEAAGNAASSGIYFYRLKAGKSILTRKMILLKAP